MFVAGRYKQPNLLLVREAWILCYIGHHKVLYSGWLLYFLLHCLLHLYYCRYLMLSGKLQCLFLEGSLTYYLCGRPGTYSHLGTKRCSTLDGLCFACSIFAPPLPLFTLRTSTSISAALPPSIHFKTFST
jgi:hypothetical protein